MKLNLQPVTLAQRSVREMQLVLCKTLVIVTLKSFCIKISCTNMIKFHVCNEELFKCERFVTRTQKGGCTVYIYK